jgi:hypothetical protein
MTKRLSILGGLAFAVMASASSAPAFAQSSNDKVLVIYGTDRCPAGTICVRKGESERFRIPKELREDAPSAHNETWASRQKSLDGVGATGAGSCSSAGPGGWTGCWAKDMQNNKATRAAVTQQTESTPN